MHLSYFYCTTASILISFVLYNGVYLIKFFNIYWKSQFLLLLLNFYIINGHVYYNYMYMYVYKYLTPSDHFRLVQINGSKSL